MTEKVEYKHLYGKETDKIRGRLLGGCLDALVQLVGTKSDNTVTFCKQFPEGMLWYLENCEQNTLSLFRMLFQMKQAGWFENAKGILMGRTMNKETIKDFSYEYALHKVFDGLNIPVIYDIDIGHLAPNWTMINGAFGEFEYSKGQGKIIQKLI